MWVRGHLHVDVSSNVVVTVLSQNVEDANHERAVHLLKTAQG